MTPDRWRDPSLVAPSELRSATLELHWALQYVASAGQTFAEPKQDDSHRASRWDPELRAFVGEPFAGAYPFRVAVRPEDLTLLMIDRTGAELGALPLEGRPREEGFAWLALGVATYLGGAPPYLERPEYDVPAHPVADEAPFSAALTSELRTLSALYAGAAELLEEVAGARAESSTVRCWPHHFDIATLITAGDSTVGVGFAPMGGGYDEWYWYVTPWPYPDTSALPALEAGAWHTEGWTGAVLGAEEIMSLRPEERTEAIRRFLSDAIDKAHGALGAADPGAGP